MTTLILLALAAGPAQSFTVEVTQPRIAIDAGAVTLPQGPDFEMEHASLVVKFRDGVRARAGQDGRVAPSGLAQFRAETQLALGGLTEVRFSQLIRSSQSKLESLQARAATRSGRAQPDLAGLVKVEFDGVPTRAEFLELGEALRALPDVEFVTAMMDRTPPPEDYAPMTPDHAALQGYVEPDPGLNYEALWAVGADGSGVRFSDCEYGWEVLHEDLVDRSVIQEPGQTTPPFVYANGWDDHGTAVVGINSAPHNGYGVDGAAEGSTVFVYPENSVEQGSRRVTCIINALADSSPGDVVLLEMQTGLFGTFAPAEVNTAVWMATRVGTDAGVVVVAAAGNGNANLNSSTYAPYRALGDSGAIIVGAGTANNSHNKLSFSSHGDRVDVQAWGQSVFTTGYGGFATYGGDDRQTYTSSFNGTSSASALIAGAAVLLQSRAQQLGYPPLSSQGMRALLKVGATPQGSGANIGPFPDLEAARLELECGGANYCVAAPNETSESGARITSTGLPSLAGSGITLGVESATSMSIGYFLMGGAATQVPVAGGFLCIDSGPLSLYRLLPPITLDAGGSATRSFSYGSAPGSLLNPGDFGYFQFWFRDPNGPHGESSNFSDARAIQFCP